MKELFDIFSDCHEFFKVAVDHSKPVYVDNDSGISTAAVGWDESDKKFILYINTEFWNDLGDVDKAFVLAHEIAHIVFKHPIRFKEFNEKHLAQISNIGMDLFVNQFVDKFIGIPRELLDDSLQDNLCWIDTIFDSDEYILDDQSSEYYTDKLLKKYPEAGSLPESILVFDPFGEECQQGSGGGPNTEIPSSAYDEVGLGDSDSGETIDGLLKELVDNGFEKTSCQRGVGNGGLQSITIKKVKKKPWESVIKRWVRQKIREKRVYDKRWGWDDRRFSTIMYNTNIELPATVKCSVKHKLNEKLNLFLFLDASGSCIGLKNRFFSAAASIPQDRFNVRLFSFDCYVQELDLKKREIYGGGGTRFDIIESEIQRIMKKDSIKYPDQVFIVTDGYGNGVRPEKPERWQWFLTPYNGKYCIPKESKIHELKNYA